jgi:hypothetical protein
MLDWTVSSHDTIGPAYQPCFIILLVRNGGMVLPSLRVYRRVVDGVRLVLLREGVQKRLPS